MDFEIGLFMLATVIEVGSLTAGHHRRYSLSGLLNLSAMVIGAMAAMRLIFP